MFRSFVLSLAFALAAASPAAEASRALEFGENFTIESLHYVRHLSDWRGSGALISSDCGAEFEVWEGSYLGRNSGRIVRITQDEIVMIEVIPDGNDGWKEEERRIGLSSSGESNQPSKPGS